MFQFLIGTVLPNLKIHWKNHIYTYVSIPYRYGITLTLMNFKTSALIVSIPYRYGITFKKIVKTLKFCEKLSFQFLIGTVLPIKKGEKIMKKL